MNGFPQYPLRSQPIYQYRLWGGRRLDCLLSAPLPGEDPIGEAWLLSDRDDHPSLVADGPLKGKTIQELITLASEQLIGRQARHLACCGHIEDVGADYGFGKGDTFPLPALVGACLCRPCHAMTLLEISPPDIA